MLYFYIGVLMRPRKEKHIFVHFETELRCINTFVTMLIFKL